MKKLAIRYFLFLSLTLSIVGCSDNSFTLYRSSASQASGGENARIHVATFDANESSSYNLGNCQLAQELFQKQDGVTVRFWCEKGLYKK